MQHTEISAGVSSHRPARRRPAGTRLAALAALSASLFLVAGCGSDDDSGDNGSVDDAGTAAVLGPVAQAEGTPVKIGVISDGKTPNVDLSDEFTMAEATAKYFNEHRSGIGGRPIELVTCEALADPGKGADCANQMVEQDVAAVVIGSSGVGESIWEPLHEAQVPLIAYTAPGGGSLQDSDSTFILNDQFFSLVTLPVEVAKDEGVEKVTVVAIDLPVTTGLYQAAEPMMEAQGVELELVLIPAGTADMTPQMQLIADGDPGVVQVVGSDAFCISSFNGLRSVGYTGPLAAIAYCVTDATREAVPGDFLEGITVSATAPLGDEADPGISLMNAIATTYGENIDTNQSVAAAMFITFAGFHAAVEEISGDITPATITAAMKAAPEKDLPGATGLRFRCNGKAFPALPSECVRGGLATVLDDEGQPTTYRPVGVSPIED